MARPLTCYGTFGMSIVQRVQPPKAALIAGRAIAQGKGIRRELGN